MINTLKDNNMYNRKIWFHWYFLNRNKLIQYNWSKKYIEYVTKLLWDAVDGGETYLIYPGITNLGFKEELTSNPFSCFLL